MVAQPVAAADGLSIQGICKSFGPTPVLHGITCTVGRGEFVTLLGPSGCGKTTLLRIIAGLEVPDAGTVTLGGKLLNPLPANRRPINTVFQSYALFPHLSVFENVAFGLRARGIAGREVPGRVGPVLEMLRIEPLAARHPHQLSGGEKQRTALARALVNEPEVLLLDEPMSALDAKLRAEVQVELRRLQRRLGRAFILVTHDQDEAMSVSDRIVVMRAGRIEQVGEPSAVYQRPRTRFVAEFLGAANLIAAERVNGSLRTALGTIEAREQPAWSTGTLVIRPEHVRIVSAPPAGNGARATVKEVIYRGSHQQILVEATAPRDPPTAAPTAAPISASSPSAIPRPPSPILLRLHAPAAPAIAIGASLWLELPAPSVETLVD